MQGLLAIHVAAVIFGTAALYGKMDVSPVWIVGVRSAYAACVLGVIGFLLKDFRKPLPGQWKDVVQSGVVLAMHWLTFFISVQKGGVAIATITFSVFPLFNLMLEGVQNRRWPGLLSMACGVGIVGAVLFLMGAPSLQGHMLGVVCGLLSALLFAVFGWASKRLGLVMSPLNISLWQTGTVALLLLPWMPFTKPMPSSLQQWGWLLCLGVVTTACMHQLYFYALRRLPASVCAGVVALEPVYAIVFAHVFFKEPCSWHVGVSGGVIFISSLLLLYDHRAAT